MITKLEINLFSYFSSTHNALPLLIRAARRKLVTNEPNTWPWLDYHPTRRNKPSLLPWKVPSRNTPRLDPRNRRKSSLYMTAHSNQVCVTSSQEGFCCIFLLQILIFVKKFNLLPKETQTLNKESCHFTFNLQSAPVVITCWLMLSIATPLTWALWAEKQRLTISHRLLRSAH